MKTYTIPACADFTITGNGDHSSWSEAPWQDLTPAFNDQSDQLSRCKLLYSNSGSNPGIYVFFECEDELLQSTGMKDGDNLYMEDVFEIFLQPNADDQADKASDKANNKANNKASNKALYLEYEVSPLGAELPLFISKLDDEFMGWSPWQYEGDRRCKVISTVQGGEQKAGATISGWCAEIFIPFALFKGFGCAPQKGSTWRANMYRIDYNPDGNTHWNWSPVQGASFHDHPNFGTLIFG